MILHVLDVSGLEGRDPIEDYNKINNELKLYNEKLATRPQLIVANKMDLAEAQENLPRVAEYMKKLGHEIYPVSAATGEGLPELMQQTAKLLLEHVEIPEETDDTIVYEAKQQEDFTIGRDIDGAFLIRGRGIERLVAMTNFDNDEGVRRFQQLFKRIGIESALKEKGVQEGDAVRIGEMEFEFRT